MGRPKSYDRAEIIELVMEIFWLKGYAATSMSDLTEATGLNKKSLYNEFGSKEALFNVAFEHYNQKRAPLVKLLKHEPLGTKNIINFLTKLANDTDKKGCLLALSINERDLLKDEAYKKVKNDFQGLRKLFELNLEQECKDPRSNNEAMALLLSAQIFSIAGMGKLKVSNDEIKTSVELLLNRSF